MPYVVSLPTLATTAWYHQKIDRKPPGGEVYADAVAFARTEYVTALIKGASLSDAERRAVRRRCRP